FQMTNNILNHIAQFSIQPYRIIAMNSGNQIGALADVRLIFFTPLNPFMILIALFHRCACKQSIASVRNSPSEKAWYLSKIFLDCCATFDKPPAPSRLLKFLSRIFMLLGVIPSALEAFSRERPRRPTPNL